MPLAYIKFEVEWNTAKAVDYERLPSEAELLCLAVDGGSAAVAGGGAVSDGLNRRSLLDVVKERMRNLPAKQASELDLAAVREQLRNLLQIDGGRQLASPLAPDENGNGAIMFESEDGMLISAELQHWSSADGGESARVCLAIGGMNKAAMELCFSSTGCRLLRRQPVSLMGEFIVV